jgi:hypothetical protein
VAGGEALYAINDLTSENSAVRTILVHPHHIPITPQPTSTLYLLHTFSAFANAARFL